MELLSNKFNCSGCGKSVTVRDYEQVIEWGKKCANCRVEHVTGGVLEMKKDYVYKYPVVKKPYQGSFSLTDNSTGSKPLEGVSLRRELSSKKRKKL